ncbi:hypothetical protein HNY73_015313 [Argiope bruennichi]|uniref:Uncharacterized protein n=1 Tax=Argiope bruennichi TaxID=94029 RepID=A0A8T0ERY7_ARGBR|nr:hypothetical protein HNY73_015313 [Argiope bruennichi]
MLVQQTNIPRQVYYSATHRKEGGVDESFCYMDSEKSVIALPSQGLYVGREEGPKQCVLVIESTAALLCPQTEHSCPTFVSCQRA